MEAMRTTKGIFAWLSEPRKALPGGELATSAVFTRRPHAAWRAEPPLWGGAHLGRER